MKRSVLLVAVILVLFAGFQESTSAQPVVKVRTDRGSPGSIGEVNVNPWQVNIPPSPRPWTLRFELLDLSRSVTSIALNNTTYNKGSGVDTAPCPDFTVPAQNVTIPGGGAPRFAEIQFDVDVGTTQGTWCNYNIVLTIEGETDPVIVDPDFRIR